MSKYFSRFPLVDYNGVPTKNILSRVDFTDATKKDIYSNFDFVLQEGTTRPDILSYNYYNSSQYDWLIYLANNIIDPYHDYYKSQEDFKSYIIKKYGSIDFAINKILFYRNDWAPDESLIPEATYDNLQPNIKKYWKPKLNNGNQIIGYERVKEDWITSTNRIVQLVVSADLDNFNVNDIIVQSSNQAKGTLVSKDTTNNSIILQHIVGDFEVSVADGIVSVTILKENIGLTEESFWVQVNAYEYEEEQNELKKYISLIKSSYLSDVDKLFVEQIKK